MVWINPSGLQRLFVFFSVTKADHNLGPAINITVVTIVSPHERLLEYS